MRRPRQRPGIGLPRRIVDMYNQRRCSRCPNVHPPTGRPIQAPYAAAAASSSDCRMDRAIARMLGSTPVAAPLWRSSADFPLQIEASGADLARLEVRNARAGVGDWLHDLAHNAIGPPRSRDRAAPRRLLASPGREVFEIRLVQLLPLLAARLPTVVGGACGDPPACHRQAIEHALARSGDPAPDRPRPGIPARRGGAG